jgi:hypothetical protein
MNNSTAVTTACTTSNTIHMDFDGAGALATVCLQQAIGPVGLNPGERGIIYFQVPTGKITTLDAGATTTLKIFAGKAGAPLSTVIANP